MPPLNSGLSWTVQIMQGIKDLQAKDPHAELSMQVTSHPELKRKWNDGCRLADPKIQIVQGLESKLPAAIVTADFSGFFDSSDDEQAMDTGNTNRAEK